MTLEQVWERKFPVLILLPPLSLEKAFSSHTLTDTSAHTQSNSYFFEIKRTAKCMTQIVKSPFSNSSS